MSLPRRGPSALQTRELGSAPVPRHRQGDMSAMFFAYISQTELRDNLFGMCSLSRMTRVRTDLYPVGFL